jgi:hypothetical protein
MQRTFGRDLLQQTTGTQQMRLADNLIERARAHPIRQRLCG